ncbi:MAG: hypothetical protein ACFFDY_05530 [Candidatus Thorarchaeota archaeon]
MVIIYHFANPDIINFFLIVAYLILILAGVQLRKQDDNIKKSSFFILSGFLATFWYIIFIFIPAFMFTTPPTVDEIQFGEIYIFIWHKLVPGLILIICLGIINIFIGLNNKMNYGYYLTLSGVISIISILTNLFDGLVFSTSASILMAISMFFYLYFSIKIRVAYLIVFCGIFLFSLAFPLIMPDHWIHIF